ncbi:hypothetical protein TNCV_3696641 [Trichonephila clavipes]|uniref:Uncharacterized protein n=1 Tax=Trichonephila clavipes TaxID=2585209 RepID=A0A8X6SIB5_TRICX|nr:hypothetical protein TNCV_3696641 [Trichonephila clavipes]
MLNNVFRGVLYHSSWRCCESSRRDAGEGYRFLIECSKIYYNGSIPFRSSDYVGQGRCFTSSCSPNHDCTNLVAWISTLSSWKIPSPAGYKICIIGWTWSAKISLFFTPVIHPFRVTMGPAEKHDPYHGLTVG